MSEFRIFNLYALFPGHERHAAQDAADHFNKVKQIQAGAPGDPTKVCERAVVVPCGYGTIANLAVVIDKRPLDEHSKPWPEAQIDGFGYSS